MAKRPASDKATREPTVVNRWWVDLGGVEKGAVKRPAGPVGSRFYEAAHDFEQEVARERLTDNNLKIVLTADPPDGDWVYVRLAETTYPQRELARIKKLIALPKYARGVIVDCGRSIRILLTGTPPGERLLELTLGEAPSFDCWVHQEWVEERVFPDADKALRALHRLMRTYLSPDSVREHDTITARA